LLWETPVDNLAIIWDTGIRQELRYQFHFQQRGKNESDEKRMKQPNPPKDAELGHH